MRDDGCTVEQTCRQEADRVFTSFFVAMAEEAVKAVERKSVCGLQEKEDKYIYIHMHMYE